MWTHNVWVRWLPLAGMLCQLALVVYYWWQARRRDRAHIARITAAWDQTVADLTRVNAEADVLAQRVIASAKRFRETFGVEELPPQVLPPKPTTPAAVGELLPFPPFRARRPSGWN